MPDLFLPRPLQSRAEPYIGIFLLLLLLTFVKIEVGPSLFPILYQYDISFPFTGLFLITINHKDPFITIISKANLKGKMSLHKCINQLLVKNNIKFKIKWILNQVQTWSKKGTMCQSKQIKLNYEIQQYLLQVIVSNTRNQIVFASAISSGNDEAMKHQILLLLLHVCQKLNLDYADNINKLGLSCAKLRLKLV